MSRQSDCDIESDKSGIAKIKNFDTLAERLAKYSSLTDKHKTIFLANDDEDDSSDEDLDLSDEVEETYTRSDLVDDDVDTVQRDQDFIDFA